jgi:biotin operon repressor
MSFIISDLRKSFISDVAVTSATKNPMTQKEIILNRLQNGEWLSSVQAIRELYITRLGARIWDLRHDGYQIEERRVEGKAFSEYRLRPSRPITLPAAFDPKPRTKTNQKLF